MDKNSFIEICDQIDSFNLTIEMNRISKAIALIIKLIYNNLFIRHDSNNVYFDIDGLNQNIYFMSIKISANVNCLVIYKNGISSYENITYQDVIKLLAEGII